MEAVQQPFLDVLPPWPVLVTIWAVVICGSILQISLGMGFGLAVGPLLALIEPSFVPGPTLLLGMLTALFAAIPERQNIQWREVSVATMGRIAGVLAAVTVLSFLPDRKTFLLTFGVMILIALLFSVSGGRLRFNNWSLSSMGFVSGLTGTITSVGAPPMAIVYQDHKPSQARPTLSAFFAIGCLISIIGLATAGWFRGSDFYRVLILFIPVLVGTWVGRHVIAHLDHRYRYALWLISGVAAMQLIIRGLS